MKKLKKQRIWYNLFMQEFTKQEKPPQIQFPAIAQEIQNMVDIDQSMREKAITDPTVFDFNPDIVNTKRMKEIVSEIGWPTISKVGKTGSNNAWLLVQHADLDIEFQKNCLNLMKELPQEEVDARNIAYLTDRICASEKTPQIYGTQFHEVDGKLVPQNIEDIDNVNVRRKEVGLETIEEYAITMNKQYGKR